MTKTGSVLLENGLRIKSYIEGLFEEKNTSKELDIITDEISKKNTELLLIKKELRKELSEKIISENPELRDFMNADCSSSFYGLVGREITFSIVMLVLDVYIGKKSMIHTCFKSSILNISDLKLKDFKLIMSKISKTVYQNYSIIIDASLNKTEGTEGVFYSLEIKKIK
ncbi:MAG: hypothetical protein WA101_01815 [Minisyncoccia bacterium]